LTPRRRESKGERKKCEKIWPFERKQMIMSDSSAIGFLVYIRISIFTLKAALFVGTRKNGAIYFYFRERKKDK
jgi:hypothetical protein